MSNVKQVDLVDSSEGLGYIFGKRSKDELRVKKSKKGWKPVVARKKRVGSKQMVLKREKDSKRDVFEEAKNTWELGKCIWIYGKNDDEVVEALSENLESKNEDHQQSSTKRKRGKTKSKLK